MGLFDGILGNLVGNNNGSANNAQPFSNPLIQMAMQMLSHQGGGQSTATDNNNAGSAGKWRAG